MPLLPGIVQALFNLEDNPIRFEKLCLDLYSAAEGVELVPTSRTWDLGRDGRCISISGSGKEIVGVLCATLSTGIETKVEADIRRLVKTTATKAIVYCSSRSLTELACAKIEATIRELYPKIDSVRVLGQIQLMALGERFESILRHHYAAEIQNIEQALQIQPTASPEPEHIGLRLALITQTGDDARTLRSQLTRRLVSDNLNAKGPQTPGQLAVIISGQLHLPRSLSGNYISEISTQLESEGLVELQGEQIIITKSGIEFVNTIPEEAGIKLLEGRAAIRDAIKTLSGHALISDQYEKVWNSLQDGLSELFYSHGAAIVRMVASLITGERVKPEGTTLILLDKIGDHIGSLFSEPTQGSEVRQAIIDMFSEKDSSAFEWLTQICTVYIMMCSLGFESLSSQQVTRVLRNFRLVPDTDIIISLLCEREKNHPEVSRIISGWRQLGGKLLMATPVLEEAASHAWISERDFTSMGDQLTQISDSEADHLIENAFVRTFKSASKGLTTRKYWDRYISQYRGDTKWDYGRIMEILREEYGFDRLPDAEENYKKFPNQVKEILINKVSKGAKVNAEELDFRMQDKCRRDGVLFGAVLAARDLARESGVQTATIILSSSRLLKEADEIFRDELGQPDAVASTAALGCLLALTPGVQMGLGTLRGVLFDMGLATRLTPIQKYAYRLIAASGEFDVPWSKRVTLQRELGERLLTDARVSGEPVRKIRERVLRSGDPEYSVKILADALDKMALTPKIEKELRQLRTVVKKLEKELLESKG